MWRTIFNTGTLARRTPLRLSPRVATVNTFSDVMLVMCAPEVVTDTCISSVFRRRWESIQVLTIANARLKGTKTQIGLRESGGSPSISAIRQDRNIILVSTPMFSGVSFSVVPSLTKYTVSFCQKSRWRTLKLKNLNLAVYSRCWNDVGITKPFGVFTHGKENWVLWINISDVETGSTYNTGCMQDRDAIPAATPMFSRMSRRMEHWPTSKYGRVSVRIGKSNAKTVIYFRRAVTAVQF